MAAIETDITWAGDDAVHRDRLVMPEAALQADGALIRALADLDANGEAAIDPGRWITPTGVEIRTLPTSAFRLRDNRSSGVFTRA